MSEHGMSAHPPEPDPLLEHWQTRTGSRVGPPTRWQWREHLLAFVLSLIPWTAFAFALMLFIDAYGVGFPKTWESFAAAVCFGVGFGSRKLA